MTPERWRQIEELYHAARECGPEVLKSSDPELRKKVENLLAQEDSFLDRPAWEILKLKAGDRLGPYEILSKLGEGGMGEVFRAYDARLGRNVALKTLPADLAGDTSHRHRFETEARAAARLNYPNIVAVFDVGIEDGISYFVTELVDGQPLRESKFGLAKALDIAKQIAAALAAAHDAGIVHRDLKP